MCLNNNTMDIIILRVKNPAPIKNIFWIEILKTEILKRSESNAKIKYRFKSINTQLKKIPIPFLLKISCDTIRTNKIKAIGFKRVAVDTQ